MPIPPRFSGAAQRQFGGMLHHVGAAAAARFDDPLAEQRHHRHPGRHLAHVGATGDLPIGGQPPAYRNRRVGDVKAQLVRQGFGEFAVRNRSIDFQIHNHAVNSETGCIFYSISHLRREVKAAVMKSAVNQIKPL